MLDGASYKSLLDDYLLYSGIYSTHTAASTALKSLKKSFPAAKVIHVVPIGAAASNTSVGSGASIDRGRGAAAAAPAGVKR